MGSSGGTAQAAAPTYQFQNLPQADAGVTSGVQQLQGQNFAGQNQGQVQGIANGIANGSTVNAAGTQSAANNLTGQTNSLIPFATQALNTAFDPNQQVYNQQFQQNTDQTRAAEAAQGTAGTPYGAGVESQADTNFNTAWQNNLLQRQTQGAQTASSLLGAAGNAATTGTNLNQSVGNNALSALSTADQTGAMANQNTQTGIQDLLSYLSGGTAANNAATNATNASNAAEEANFSQNQSFMNNIGAGVGTLFGGLNSPIKSGSVLSSFL